jgi:hypothetical protein
MAFDVLSPLPTAGIEDESGAHERGNEQNEGQENEARA